MVLPPAAQLQKGLVEVRAVLGPSIPVSDKDIEDSLWHYYYDTEKTVDYLLRMSRICLLLKILMNLEQQTPAQPKKKTKKAKGSQDGIVGGESCSHYEASSIAHTHTVFSAFHETTCNYHGMSKP